MSRFFAFSVILMGILIAHIVCPKPPATIKELKPATSRSEVNVGYSGKCSNIKSTEKQPNNLSKTTTETPLQPNPIERSKVEKSSTSNATKRRTRRTRSAGSSNKPKQSPAVTNAKSKTLDTDDSRWILKDFKKKEVDRFYNGNREWEERGYYNVFLRKGIASRYLNLDDKKNHAVIKLNAYYNGNIEQNWSFDDGQAVITIHKNAEFRTQREEWTFPKSTLKFKKHDNGTELEKMWSGPVDLQSLRKYEKYIKGWCVHNEFLIGEGKCFVTNVSSILMA